MSSVHGVRGQMSTRRSSSTQRITVSTSSIPISGVVARVRAMTRVTHHTRATQHAATTTRQNQRTRATSATAVTTRRNTAPTLVARVAPMQQNSVGSGEEVVDLTCNSPQRSARRAQLPVVLGGGPSTRVPVKPVSKANLRKRPTAAPSGAVGVSPTKKCRNMQEMMCPVCLDEISLTNPVTEKPVFSTNCGHLFCKPCIISCLGRNNSCPICRKCQNLTDIHPIYTNENF